MKSFGPLLIHFYKDFVVCYMSHINKCKININLGSATCFLLICPSFLDIISGMFLHASWHVWHYIKLTYMSVTIVLCNWSDSEIITNLLCIVILKHIIS